MKSLTGQRHDRVQTESQQLQPWTAVSTLLGLIGCTCVVSSTGFPFKNYMRNGITFTSHGPVLECKHSAPVDVYLRLAYVLPFENNFIDSHGNV